MENEQKNPFEQFITAAEKYVEMWTAIEMKVVAIKKDNTYLLLGLHATILTDAMPASEILFDLEGFIMLREIRYITHTQLNEIIRGLENGIIKIGDDEFKIDFQMSDFNYSHGHKRGPFSIDWEWPYIWLRVYGSKNISELINVKEINRGLNKWGYADLESACQENLGFMVGGSYLPHIHLLAPIYLIADAQINQDKLIFSVKCHKSINIEDIVISYGTEGDTPKHNSLGFTPNDMLSQQENFNELQKITSLTSETKSIRFWTYYKNEVIDENWIHKPIEKLEEINPKLMVIEPLFSKEEGKTISGKTILERNLGLETKPPRDAFESAILNLMSIAGFEVIFAGKGFDAQGIDILAFPPGSSDVIVVSCTISNNIGDKIRTLLSQINKLKRHLENYEVIPTIFSPIKCEDVVYSDNGDARQHKIALLLSHEINEIYQAIQTTPSNKIREFVLNYIKNKRYAEV